jgi:hypothetical protein
VQDVTLLGPFETSEGGTKQVLGVGVQPAWQLRSIHGARQLNVGGCALENSELRVMG